MIMEYNHKKEHYMNTIKLSKENFKFAHFREKDENGEYFKNGGGTIGWSILTYADMEYIAIGVTMCHPEDQFNKRIATDNIVTRIVQTVNSTSMDEASPYAWVVPKGSFDAYILDNAEKFFPYINSKMMFDVVTSMSLSNYTYDAFLSFAKDEVDRWFTENGQ